MPRYSVLSAILDQFQEGLVNAAVIGQFGVEGGGHGFALTNYHRVLTFRGEDFDLRAEALDFRCANEDHFDGRTREETFADGALELASIGVAANANVEGAEPGLARVLDFFGKQDGAGAGTEGGLEAHEFFQFGKTGFAQELQKCTGFAAGDD